MKKIALFVTVAGCMVADAATPNVGTPPPVGRPMLVSPAGTVEDGDCVTFSWQASENAGGYVLQVSPAPDFIPSMTTEVNAGTSTTAVVKGLYPDKTYWWTVWARRTAKGRLAVRSFPANFRTAPRKDGQTCDGKLRPSLLPDACYMDDIPTLEISGQRWRQAILGDGTVSQYNGHVYTTLAPDGQTVWAAFTLGDDHQTSPPGPLARTTDGGRTWERLDERLPPSFRERHDGSPILRSVKRPDGTTRFIIFSRSKTRQLVTTISDDLGETWRDGAEFPIPTGMAPTGLMLLKDGRTALFGQTGSTPMKGIPEKASKTVRKTMTDCAVWMSVTADGGDSWNEPRIVAELPGKYFCEPFCVRSRDGAKLALILREQTHLGTSMVCFSSDEGKTWSRPQDTPWGLTGDRHEGVCLSDGRLFIAFRDKAPGSSMCGQYVAWVGTWEDLEMCRPGQYRIHLLRHYPDTRRGWSWGDCGYGGVHELADGTIVCTTYLKNAPDDRRHSVMSTRLKMKEMDDLALVERTKAKTRLIVPRIRPFTVSPAAEPEARDADDMPLIDISGDAMRQTVIDDGTESVYKGHIYTTLGPDGQTIYAMYTSGDDHASADAGPFAKSSDAGRTWKRLDKNLPPWFKREHLHSPILRSLKRPDGSTRFVVFSRDATNNIVTLVSDDLGESWRKGSGVKVIACMGPTGLIALKDGRTALFGQTGRIPKEVRKSKSGGQKIWMSVTADGGDSWSVPRIIAAMDEKDLCEPFCIRSPDGRSLALILREQTHEGRSKVCFSRDEGETWSPPVDTPWGLTGDRHEGTLLSDGRLFIAFRDMAIGSATAGQYVAWVGTWEDLEKCRPGQYRVKLLHHYADTRRKWSWYDCGYSGVHQLADGTIVCVTYLKNAPDTRRHSVMSTRLKIEETDELWKRAVRYYPQPAALSFALPCAATKALPEYDVVVCGGGPAGIAASIAAARSGLKTLLLELNGCVGGTSTSGALPFWLGAYRDSIPYKRMLAENIPYSKLRRERRAVSGIFDELMAKIRDAGGGSGPAVMGQTDKYPGLDRLGCHDEFTFDIEIGKRVMEQAMLEAGVEIRYYARVVDAKRSGDRVEGVAFVDKGGRQYVPAKVVIDCTGDADVVAAAGFATYKGDRVTGQLTGAGIVAHMEGIDSAALEKYLNEGNDPRFRPIIAKALKENPGADWPERLIIFPMVQDGVFMVNGGMSFYGYDGTDGKSMTELTIRARKRAAALVDLFQRYLPGGKNCRLRLTAPYPGIRETRRIEAERQLTEKDLLDGTVFPDVIALAGRHFDLARPNAGVSGDHVGVQTFGEKKVKMGVTTVPYRALLPKGADNLIVAGRCIGADGQAMGPCRIMSTCMATGQAAGTAAKFKLAAGCPFRAIDVQALRAALRAVGGIVDP